MPTKNDEKSSPGDNSTSVFDSIESLMHERRILLLKALLEEKKPIAFMDLLRKVRLPKEESPDVSYHLSKLAKNGIVIQQESKYFLSNFGEELLKKFFEMEDIYSVHNSDIMVRTSRYCMESFSEDKIVASLIGEAGMPPQVATDIARETRIRLQRAKVKYLTTPLIREYINAILIEKHLEDYRHKLTRLGLPGQELECALHKHGLTHLPRLREDIGRETLEQFVLLRILPKTLADALLQQTIGVGNLSSFPFLADSMEIHWREICEDAQPSLEKLLVFLLDIIVKTLPRVGRVLSIIGVPLPSGNGSGFTPQVERIAQIIGEMIRRSEKQVRVSFQSPTIFDGQLWVLFSGEQMSPLESYQSLLNGAAIPRLTETTRLLLGAGEIPLPIFETFYCNLLGWHDNYESAKELTPATTQLAKMIAQLISAKEEAILAYGKDDKPMRKGVIKVVPVGIGELVRGVRGFGIEQIADSERFAGELLGEIVSQVTRAVRDDYVVHLGQCDSYAILRSFAQSALGSLSKGDELPPCSPGFLTLPSQLTASKCLGIAGRVLGQLPGEFSINLPHSPPNPDELAPLFRGLKPGAGRRYHILGNSRLRFNARDFVVGNYF